MLDSLKGEVSAADAITIIFDGEGAQAKAGWEDTWKEGLACPVTVHVEPVPLKFWGHAARNKWQTRLQPQTTFIMHADDDDYYHDGFLDKLRRDCTNPNTFYIAKMRDVKRGYTVPNEQRIFLGNIGTPCGIVPWSLAGKGIWQPRVGGDMEYFRDVSTAAGAGNTVYLPHLIYEVTHV
jgi:hypothetical protein